MISILFERFFLNLQIFFLNCAFDCFSDIYYFIAELTINISFMILKNFSETM